MLVGDRGEEDLVAHHCCQLSAAQSFSEQGTFSPRAEPSSTGFDRRTQASSASSICPNLVSARNKHEASLPKRKSQSDDASLDNARRARLYRHLLHSPRDQSRPARSANPTVQMPVSHWRLDQAQELRSRLGSLSKDSLRLANNSAHVEGTLAPDLSESG